MMSAFLLNLSLSVTLFFLNGILGKIQYSHRKKLFEYGRFHFSVDESENFSGNFFLKIVNPTIFAAISSAIFQNVVSAELCKTLWLIVPFYWAIRFFYVVIKNYFLIINWKYELFSFSVSLLLAVIVFFCLIIPLIDAGESVFVPITALRDAVWYGILAYIAVSIWNIGKSLFGAYTLFPMEKRRQIVFKKYDKFSQKFGSYILETVNQNYPKDKDGKKQFICFLYAIMIYEDYNRPWCLRCAERILKVLFPKREMTLGIMQIKTKTYISDLQSIDLAVEKLSAVYCRYLHNAPFEHAVLDYNPSDEYADEVYAIYEMILELLSIDDLIDDNESYRI